MLGRCAHVLVALVVALAVMLPVGGRAMSMPAGMAGAALQRHCVSCPGHSRTGGAPDMAPACQFPACAGALAALPGPTLLPGRILLQSAYLAAPPIRLTGAAPAPDPFPPRPISLV